MEIKEAYQFIVRALSHIYGESEAQSVVRILFEDAFNITNPQKIGSLLPIQQKRLVEYTERLLQKEPVQYVLQQADFYGMKLRVTPDVLIPRQETEELVAWIVETYKYRRKIRIVDIGTGSGCIALALKKQLPHAEIWAVDVSRKALMVARNNAQRYDLDVFFRKLDILDSKMWYSLPQFDVIVSNPPYISTKEKNKMPEWVLKYEPHLALFSKGDPLLFYKTIAAFAQQNANKYAKLFFELNEFNATKVQKILEAKGFDNMELRQDLNGKDRMLACG